jgi:hypothetical protein
MTTPLEQVYEELHERELAYRDEIFDDHATLTAAQVADTCQPPGLVLSVERWRAEMRVFAFSHRGQDRYAAFQFQGGMPKAVIQQVLEHLASPDPRPYREPPFSDWATMFWFVGANVWLDDKLPFELLDEDPKAVVMAAGHARDAISD